MTIKEAPEKVARWMQRGTLDLRGVACLIDDAVYIAFNEHDSGRVHVLVFAGGQEWLDAFLAALGEFECKQAYGKVDFAKATLALWPNDESVRKLADIANVSGQNPRS
jgi:hypothetical protein